MGERAAIDGKSRSRGDDAIQKIRFTSWKGRTPLERFAEKCAFDPYTGCVMWIAGQTSGHGHSEPYGRYWDSEAKRMVLAHRWSAENIHGFDIEGLQVDHCCPAGPSTLCVEHVKPETAEVNRFLQSVRPGRAFQDLTTKQHWLFVQRGIKTLPPVLRVENDVPFFLPPAWLKPFLNLGASPCPF